MDTGLLLQYLAIAAAVLISVWVVANKQFPGGMRKLRIALALPLLREGRAAWLRVIGRWIAPPGRAADTACGGCNNCDPPAAGK
ncbi:DUF6587 family protein [Pseudoxanthomonas wuyuanensis]